MNFRQGEILFDPNFIYPDGGQPCDKLLLVVNKLHIYPTDVVIIPCKTHINDHRYRADCNEIEKIFYIDEKIGFYNKKTIVQLYHIELKPALWLKELIVQKRIDRLNKYTTQEEFGRILNCLKRIKEDISQEIQDLIF